MSIFRNQIQRIRVFEDMQRQEDEDDDLLLSFDPPLVLEERPQSSSIQRRIFRWFDVIQFDFFGWKTLLFVGIILLLTGIWAWRFF